LSSIPDTLFSTCSTLFTKISTMIFIWDTELIQIDYFSGFLYLHWFPCSYPG
jgi:hypothetical protein